MNKEEIMNILPHRPPFLYVDEIVDIVDGENGNPLIIGKKTFTEDEYFFKGHFPTFPVVPGVILLEAMAQAGAVYALMQEEYKGKIAFFAGADNVKWKRQVLPNDTIIMKIQLEKARHGVCKAHAEAYVEDLLACSADLLTFIR